MPQALILTLALAFPGAEPAWHEHYRQGIELLERGEAALARAALEAALAQRPQPELGVRLDPVTMVDYLPHLYLAAACHAAGDLEAARRHLEESERAGVAARSESGRQRLSAYRLLLAPAGEADAVLPGEGDSAPGYTRFEAAPGSLGEEELAELQRRVLGRCGLDPDTPASRAPWYFHYEMGLELAHRDDPQRAVAALIEAARRRPEPQHGARIYGMWFRDYLPYYRIAQAHAELGNWDCAADALRVSEREGEIPEDDREHPDLVFLRREVESRLTQ